MSPVDPDAPRPGMIRFRWIALPVAAVLGWAVFAAFSQAAARAGFSYLGGMLVTTVILEASTFNIRYTDRYLPRLTLPVAVLSYAITAIALAVVLAASSPRVVDGPGAAGGLVAAVLIWVGTEVARLRVRS